MELVLNNILFALSAALDCVEGELIGVTTNHSKRVALISVRMAEALGVMPEERFYLASAAVMHDNALTEYIQEERNRKGLFQNTVTQWETLGNHCAMGEENVRALAIYPHIQGAILYHHECANGGGPFGKKPEETPLFARLIHFADTLDSTFNLRFVRDRKYERIQSFAARNRGILFDDSCVETFQNVFSPEAMKSLSTDVLDDELRKSLPELKYDYDTGELVKLSTIFAKIIDYKSHVACTHSVGVAQKARHMACYYGWDEETQAKMYFAGALHDIGKLLIDNDILEKPGRLTAEEYKSIQNHAMGTYSILSRIDGLEDITSWASLHHEKLDGSGYPFGKTAEELGEKERLMMCLDIYQALREPRSYKEGMSHEETMKIIREMADRGQLDEKIVMDVDCCFGRNEEIITID